MNTLENELLGQYKLTLISEALKVARDIDPNLSIASFIHLIHVIKAGEEGITPSELAISTGNELSTVSRQLTILKDTGRGNKGGLGLIKLAEKTTDGRCKPVALADKGEKLKRLLMAL